MHVRASHIRGMHVVDDSTQHSIGSLDDPLIDPDSGKILGFFVQAFGRTLFLNVLDIVQWGTKVHVRSADQLSPPEELVRLEKAMHDARTMLYQPIRTRPGRQYRGRCMDVQFDSTSFIVEWMFPRKFFFSRNPIPTTDIIEITKNAIWVRPELKPSTVPLTEKDEITTETKVEAPAPATMKKQ